MNRPIEEYVKNADELAQDVINAWGSNWEGGKGHFTPEFKVLLDNAFPYWQTKKEADSYRECFGTVSERIATRESESRLTFARAFKAFWERHEKN